jgi:hypothetical protein
MKRSFLTLCGMSLAAVLLCPAAYADTFNFSYSGTGTLDSTITTFSGSGSFTASPVSGNEYLISAINPGGTALVGGVSSNITGLIPVSPGFDGNDNELFDPLEMGGALDGSGFSFMTADGTDYNIYYYESSDSQGYAILTSADPNGGTTNLMFTLTDETTGASVVTPPGPTVLTPEPGSLMLLATGVFGIAGAMRRRFAV